ncbi:DNA-binding transcriptional regulator, LysR family [Pseudomonas sp. NFR09]|uniref:LysR family transcriptional regulator n=1 Tax=Pseudomonas sp. NFR09 TaxID=1566249 RepID=UPI0008CCC380|nr:LysR family transcriptional regulator [Pseudomonas sp. NFR09]SET64665.1 DNA-binding transcriptional regulator, LysR family [Pseudomonas sp. NFR09]
MFKYAHSFCVLAQELHFSRAASRLHLTQPALSHQIKKLEEEIGCTLLVRSPQKVMLTEAGVILAKELAVALNQMSNAVQQAQDAERGESGALAIGYCELPEAGRMSLVIRRYTAMYPGVDVTLRKLSTNDQVVALASGSIDVAFLHPPVNSVELMIRSAGDEWMVAALPANHALAALPTLRLADLKAERLIVCAEETGAFMYNSILAAFGNAGFQPRLREEKNSWHTMLDQATSGLGVALVPQSLIRAGNSQLVFRAVDDLNVKLETAIATAADSSRPAVSRFLEVAGECLAKMENLPV